MTSNENYAQGIRLVKAAAHSIILDVQIEVMGKDGSPIETVKWSIFANMDTTWAKLTYSILAAIKKANNDLPIDYTTAIFALQPNKVNPLQARYKIKKNFDKL